MKKILSCIKGLWLPTILCPIFVIFEVIIEVSLPKVMAQIVDIAIPNGDLNLVLKLGSAMVIFAMVSLIFGGLAGWVCSIAGAGLARNLRKKQFATIQNFSFANIDKFSTGSLVTRMTTDVSFVQMAFQQIIRGLVRSPIMFVVSRISAFGISPKMTLIFLIVAPILAIGLTFISLFAHPNFKKMFKRYDSMNPTIQENLYGIPSLSEFAVTHQKNAQYIGRLFKSETGMSFGEYCNGLRLEKATRLLVDRNKKIIDIATECGFENVTYFNRLFKKRYGVSPMKWR